MGNTLFYAAVLIILSIVVNGLAGYALAKIKFPFRDQWLMVIIMLLIVPTETVITIHFLIIAKAGLLNTIVGYILPLIVNPFNIFLFRQVFTSSDLLTAQIGLNSITSNENTTMGQTLAVITLVTIPVIIIYSLFSKQIVEGVTSTGSKEG